MENCQVTRSTNRRYVRVNGNEVTTTRLIVETHSAGPEVAYLLLDGRHIEMGVEEAVKLYDKFPGQKVLVNRGVEDCDEHQAPDEEDELSDDELEAIASAPDVAERAALDATFGGAPEMTSASDPELRPAHRYQVGVLDGDAPSA